MAVVGEEDMEIIQVEMEKPVPSLPVSKVKFSKDGKWTYIYSFKSDVKLTNKESKEPLYLKGGLPSMSISKKNPNNSTNLIVRSLKELKQLLEDQRKSDLEFRKEFVEEHKDNIEDYQENIFVLDNKTQELGSAYIVKVKRKRKDSTVFVGRC